MIVIILIIMLFKFDVARLIKLITILMIVIMLIKFDVAGLRRLGEH